jgi:hypothetical protein
LTGNRFAVEIQAAGRSFFLSRKPSLPNPFGPMSSFKENDVGKIPPEKYKRSETCTSAK